MYRCVHQIGQIGTQSQNHVRNALLSYQIGIVKQKSAKNVQWVKP
jgi:c-di-AMP phosphodiesterase-like protein